MPTPNPKLKDFWLQRTVNGQRVRFRVLYGGRSSSKSWDAAARVAWLAHKGKLRILCTRMYQNKIADSVYETIKTQVNRFGWNNHFEFRRGKITTDSGSEFLFRGIARNVEEIKSTEGIDLVWIEEGQSLEKDMWDQIEPTIRKEGSEIWMIFNPQYRTDFIWQRFVESPPANALVRQINYDDNPFLSDTIRKAIQRMKQEDYDNYLHIYEGQPKEDEDDIIIKRSWIQAAVGAHKQLGIEPTGTQQIGFDVADSGNDKNAVALRHGVLIEQTDQWSGGQDQLNESTKKVYGYGKKVIYDSIGVGAGVGSTINDLNELQNRNIQHQGFSAGGKVVNPNGEYREGSGIINKDQFKNLKAQAWQGVADRFRTTYNAVTKDAPYNSAEIISIAKDCNYLSKLINELSAPKKEYDAAGRMKVESKKKMAKRGIASPNLADAVIMAFAPNNSVNIETFMV